MAEINPINIQKVNEVQPITDLQEMIQHLLDGKVLRVEQEEQGTILVRMNPGKYNLTEISRDVNKETYFYKRYWLPYNISINALLTFTVYLDEIYHETTNKFNINDVVEYTKTYELTGEESKDVAFVTDVLQDQENNYYYKLSGELEKLFPENDIKVFDKNNKA